MLKTTISRKYNSIPDIKSPIDRIKDDIVCQYNISHWIKQFSH